MDFIFAAGFKKIPSIYNYVVQENSPPVGLLSKQRSSFGDHRCVTPLNVIPMWSFACIIDEAGSFSLFGFYYMRRLVTRRHRAGALRLWSEAGSFHSIGRCLYRPLHNTIKDPHRYAVQGSDTTMMTSAPFARIIIIAP